MKAENQHQSEVKLTENLTIKNVPTSLRNEIFTIAAKKGITVSSFLKQELHHIRDNNKNYLPGK